LGEQTDNQDYYSITTNAEDLLKWYMSITVTF
jgi:hypothetical protein